MRNTGSSGKIYLVGIGPGSASGLTLAASAALQECQVVVGYRLYIEQLSLLLQDTKTLAMELGQEMERAGKAVELARAGQTVAVVSSGDVGIYGMAGPVFQTLVEQDWDGHTPRIEVIPGISALQASAALLGSPIMQDFCAISLSDLLTPWEAIRRRVEAASQADFVIAFYNPRSRQRDWQLAEARRILLQSRPGATPVGITRNAGRPGQQISLTTLDQLEYYCPSIDMVTTVIVGNSSTYAYQGFLITPRGYPGKVAPPVVDAIGKKGSSGGLA